MTTPFTNSLLFIVLPYLAMCLFLLGTIWRYRQAPFTYSSLSSQFLENKQHFWGLVPFHYGIVAVLTAHVVAFLLPRQILQWDSRPFRLHALEVTGLAFALLALVGLIGAMVRRLTNSKVLQVTTTMDWILLLLVLVQVTTGLCVAILHPWGSAWFAAGITPYLWSLVRFNPDLSFVAAAPVLVKLHIMMAYVLIGVTPFTRLVHILVTPNPYLWRRPQVVRWYRAPKEVA